MTKSERADFEDGLDYGRAMTAPLEAARRGYWAYARFQRALLGREWTRESGRWDLTPARHPERWADIEPLWPEIRRAILDYEFAHKPTLADRLAAERYATHNEPGGWGYPPQTYRMMLLWVGSAADTEGDAEMWDELRSWPEYAGAETADRAARQLRVEPRGEFKSPEATSVEELRERSRERLRTAIRAMRS